MTHGRYSKIGVMAAGATVAIYGHAQTSPHSPSVEEFYRSLVAQGHAAPMEVQMKVANEISEARPEEIRKALPAVLAALAYDDEGVRHNALTGLFEIARRPDGAALLRDHVGAIGGVLMTSPKSETQGGAVVVLGSLNPAPPEVVPILLEFVRQKDRSTQAQVGAIFQLIHIAPQNAHTVAAIQEFLSAPIDKGTRIGVLNALGNSDVKDARLTGALFAALDDSDADVRSTAIQALTRTGRQALEQVEPVLRRLADDPNQPTEVADQARQALQTLKNGKNGP